jgi:hypothetical protein
MSEADGGIRGADACRDGQQLDLSPVDDIILNVNRCRLRFRS